MKSFSLLRTNVALTTNIKFIVDSNYNLYMESIDSHTDLSSNRFKKVQFNKENYFDELVPFFFKDFPSDIAFFVKNDESNKYNTISDLSLQYDTIYRMGAINISNNNDYKEEYEYLAPLYIESNIPNNFIIFRIDGAGFNNLTKDNFKEDYLNKFKVVKVFSLKENTPIGEFLNKSFIKNDDFPIAPLEIDFKKLEFSKWYGVDYNSGGFTSKSLFLENTLSRENLIFDLEKQITDGYKLNKVIFPNIINLSFLFDDEPATKYELRKWSINRYTGFYINEMELIDTITPFTTEMLYSDIVITKGNIIKSISNNDPFINGFNDINSYIEYDGKLFKVIKYTKKSDIGVYTTNNDNVNMDEVKSIDNTYYKIISDIDLTGKENLINKKTCYINDNNILVNLDGSPYNVNDIEVSDINIIKIGDTYHNLLKTNDGIKLITDYGFSRSDSKFEYFINKYDSNYVKTIDLIISKNNTPISFEIYRLAFSDIKDFDNNIIVNDFSKYEYETSDIDITEETKMFIKDLNSKTNPKELETFSYKGDNVNVVASSDYLATFEPFRIDDNKLSDIWNKNAISCRWGYSGSNSNNDLKYVLNNNTIYESYNRVCNTQSAISSIRDRNLDYFLSINSDSNVYLNHSLHVEKYKDNDIDKSLRFDLERYLSINENYFDFLFDTNFNFKNGEIIINKTKFSEFNKGGKYLPNTTLFKGIEFSIFKVDSIKKSDYIDAINLDVTNEFADYKFSILMSCNDKTIVNNKIVDSFPNGIIEVNDNKFTHDTRFLTSGDILEIVDDNGNLVLDIIEDVNYITNDVTLKHTNNGRYTWRNKLQWKLIKTWVTDVKFIKDEYVLYDDCIFKVLDDNIIISSDINPYNSPYFMQYQGNVNIPFWFKNCTYTYVYRQGDYYEYNENGVIDFKTSDIKYSIGDRVINNGNVYESLKNNNDSSTSDMSSWKFLNLRMDNDLLKYKKIKMWDGSYSNLVVYDDILYMLNGDYTKPPHINSSNWIRIYSMVQDTNYNYSIISNPIIKIGNSYLLCINNPNDNLNPCDICIDTVYNVYTDEVIRNTIETIENLESILIDEDINYEIKDKYDNIVDPNSIDYNRTKFLFNKIEDCKLLFDSYIEKVPSNTDIYGIFDSTSTSITDVNIALENVIKWFVSYAKNNEDYEGWLYLLHTDTVGTFEYLVNGTTATTTSSERWLYLPEAIYKGTLYITTNPTRGRISANHARTIIESGSTIYKNLLSPYQNNGNRLYSLFGKTELTWEKPKNIILMSFIDETGTNYHVSNGYHNPSMIYTTDYYRFTYDSNYIPNIDKPYVANISNFNTLNISQPSEYDGGYLSKFDYFRGLLYPVNNGNNSDDYAFIYMSAMACNGTEFTREEIDNNPMFKGLRHNSSPPSTDVGLVSIYSPYDLRVNIENSISNNPYKNLGLGLKHFNWNFYFDKRSNSKWSDIPNPWETFDADITPLVEGSIDERELTMYVDVKPTLERNCGYLTIDSGINIFINKKWKNILVNININDNTIFDTLNSIDSTVGVRRNNLYLDVNNRLTANNIITQINELDKLYGFSDYTSYIIIEEDGSFRKFNFNDNIDELPYLIIANSPDLVESTSDIKYNTNTFSIKTSNNIINNTITNDTINFYNNTPNIININNDLLNVNKDRYFINRFSGFYSPIFKNIELFKKNSYMNDSSKNYIFDTNLTNFGITTNMISKYSDNLILRTSNLEDNKSMYVIMDEFGLHESNDFIFKSNWDMEYYIKTIKNTK